MQTPPPASDDAAPVCPGCGQPLNPDGAGDLPSSCPFCGAPPSTAEAHPFVVDYMEADDEEARPTGAGHEIDVVRVRQLSALRRGAARSRSYCLVGLIACAVVSIKLVLMALQLVRTKGWSARPIGDLLGAAAAAWAAFLFFRGASQFHQELRRSLLSDPQTPPDFSGLGDGSQQWKRLEEM